MDLLCSVTVLFKSLGWLTCFRRLLAVRRFTSKRHGTCIRIPRIVSVRSARKNLRKFASSSPRTPGPASQQIKLKGYGGHRSEKRHLLDVTHIFSHQDFSMVPFNFSPTSTFANIYKRCLSPDTLLHSPVLFAPSGAVIVMSLLPGMPGTSCYVVLCYTGAK